jgi:hypothetical protein
MKKFAITIFSVLTFGVAPALAQTADPVPELQQNSDWFQTSFRDLWTTFIESSRDLQFIEDKLIQDKGAKALYKAWVLNACTVPGKEHYYNVKPGYGSPAEVSPAIYGPPEVGGKPIFGPADALPLQVVIRKNHEHLYESVCDYVREPSGKIHESAKKTIVEMCGEEAVKALDTKIAEKNAATKEQSKANR